MEDSHALDWLLEFPPTLGQTEDMGPAMGIEILHSEEHEEDGACETIEDGDLCRACYAELAELGLMFTREQLKSLPLDVFELHQRILENPPLDVVERWIALTMHAEHLEATAWLALFKEKIGSLFARAEQEMRARHSNAFEEWKNSEQAEIDCPMADLTEHRDRLRVLQADNPSSENQNEISRTNRVIRLMQVFSALFDDGKSLDSLSHFRVLQYSFCVHHDGSLGVYEVPRLDLWYARFRSCFAEYLEDGSDEDEAIDSSESSTEP